MRNVKQHGDDSLRSEYRRSNFGEMFRGKYSDSQVEFAEIVHLLLTCIGEDEKVTITHHSVSDNLAAHEPGDWTYEISNSNQITLRYWLGELENIAEPISNPTSAMTARQRTELQDLLAKHVQTLKARVDGLR